MGPQNQVNVGTPECPYLWGVWHLTPMEVSCTPFLFGSIIRLQFIMLKYCSYYYSIPEFFHAIAIIPMQSCYWSQVMLISQWEKHLESMYNVMYKSYKLWHWHLSLLALHPLLWGHKWSEHHYPPPGHCFTHFSEFSQLILPYWFAATWFCACALLLFQHNAQMLLACNYIHTMLSIIDSCLSITWLFCAHLTSRPCYSYIFVYVLNVCLLASWLKPNLLASLWCHSKLHTFHGYARN